MNIQISTEKLQEFVVHTARRPRRFIRWIIRLALVLLLIMGAGLTYLRIVGLPEGFKERVLEELHKQGLQISVGKFYIDPFGRLVGRDVLVVQSIGRDTNEIEVDRVRFDFNWVSWWRGQPFLHGAEINNASLSYGLDTGTAVKLRDVQVEIEFGQEKSLRIVRAEADLANIHLKIDGDISMEGLKFGGPPLTPEQRAARVRLWNQITGYLEEIQSPRPIQIEAEIHNQGVKWDQAYGRLVIEVRDAVWRETRFSKVSLEVDYDDSTARARVNVDLARGGLEVQANWKAGQAKADAMFHSDMDLTLLRRLFPKDVENILAETQFRSLPINQGEISFDWDNGFVFRLQARAIWDHVVIRGAEIQSLYLPVSYDGRRILVPEMHLKTERGEATFSFFYDGEQNVEGRLQSTLDPTYIKPLFGPGAQPFMNSLSFKVGPKIDAKITGTALKPEALRVEGDAALGGFTYKGASLDEATSHFVFENKELILTSVVAKRPEGEARAVEVRDNFATKQVFLKGVTCQMLPEETAIIFGDKLAGYLKPYRFLAAPKVKLEGTIDLDTRMKTNFDVNVESKEGMKYDFLKKTLTLTAIKAKLEFRAKNLTVTTLAPVHIFGGEADAVIKLLLDETGKIPYTADVKARECMLEQVLNTYFTNEEDLTGEVTASAHLSGNFNDIKSLKGPGQMTVKDGTLYSIPILGTFSNVLNDIVPNIGYSKASNADVDFDFADGVLNVSKLDVFSTGFALIGHGKYDYIKDDVDFSMRVNMRGLPGLLLFSISKLFEYQGTGTMKKTTWEPKVF